MEVKGIKISIENRALTPTLLIGVSIKCYYDIESLISISGMILSADGKIIAYMDEYRDRDGMQSQIKLLTNDDIRNPLRNKQEGEYYAQLVTQLSKNAIEHIEVNREKDTTRAVKLTFDINLKYQKLSDESHRNQSVLQVCASKYSEIITILHSEWIQNFAKVLGIGEYLLLELAIPGNRTVSKFWDELWSRLMMNLQEMQNSLRNGEWQMTLFIARKFYENIKFDKNKQGSEPFREELANALKKDQHSDEGISDLYNAIVSMFNFISKYIHDKDRSGNLNTLPIPTKEDAYFAYSLSIGFVNLLGKRMATG